MCWEMWCWNKYYMFSYCLFIFQDFVPRYGKLKVQVEKEKNWVMEVPRQSNPYEDQFAKASAAKKERIAKNEYQRLRNIARSSKAAVPGVGVMKADTRDANQVSRSFHPPLQFIQ